MLVDVREQHGFTPWYFNLPDAGEGYETAWKQLMDPKGFYAPFGPTTAEQRHPDFKISYEGHECQWNGPSWPLSTAVTLTALANLEVHVREMNDPSRRMPDAVSGPDGDYQIHQQFIMFEVKNQHATLQKQFCLKDG